MSEHVEFIAGEGVAPVVGAPPDSPPAAAPARASSANDILNARDIDETDVDVPEWGLTVRVRGIGRKQYRAIEKAAANETGDVDPDLADIHLLVAGVVDPVLSVEDATRIVEEKSITSVGRVTGAIMEASGLGAGFQA